MNESVETEINHLLGFSYHLLSGSIDTSSLEMYGRNVLAYLHFAETKEAALSPSTLASWIEYLAATGAYSPGTINRMATAVRRCMQSAGKHGSIDQAVAEGFQRVSGVSTTAFRATHLPSKRRILEPGMIERMTESPPLDQLIALRNHALLLTLVSSGLRVETCRLLQQEQLTDDAKGTSVEVFRPGDPHPLTIPLAREASLALHTWLEARSLTSSYLFTRFDGRSNTQARASIFPISRTAVHSIIRQFGATFGIPDLKPSDLRRFVGQRLAQQDIHRAQQILGYKRLATVYETCFPDEIELEPGITEGLF